jgi:hypothetical protein
MKGLKKYHKLARMVEGVHCYVVGYNVVLNQVFLCSDKEWQKLCLATCTKDEERLMCLKWWERRPK